MRVADSLGLAQAWEDFLKNFADLKSRFEKEIYGSQEQKQIAEEFSGRRDPCWSVRNKPFINGLKMSLDRVLEPLFHMGIEIVTQTAEQGVAKFTDLRIPNWQI